MPLPPLPLSVLADVEEVEDFARSALFHCGGSGYYNPEKAVRILRTCAVETLNIQLGYYESLPDYWPEWQRRVKDKTIDTILGLVGVEGRGNWDFFSWELRQTVKEHLAARARAAKQKSIILKQKPPSRKALRDSYLGTFRGVKILDICWAAKQHYREWKRWINDELKNGSTPDRAFREVLTSGKAPDELSPKPRPPKWQ